MPSSEEVARGEDQDRIKKLEGELVISNERLESMNQEVYELRRCVARASADRDTMSGTLRYAQDSGTKKEMELRALRRVVSKIDAGALSLAKRMLEGSNELWKVSPYEYIAHLFHETYERFATELNYETRKESKEWNKMLFSHRQLMVKTCEYVFSVLLSKDGESWDEWVGAVNEFQGTADPWHIEMDDEVRGSRDIWRIVSKAAVEKRKQQNCSARPPYVATVYSKVDAEHICQVHNFDLFCKEGIAKSKKSGEPHEVKKPVAGKPELDAEIINAVVEHLVEQGWSFIPDHGKWRFKCDRCGNTFLSDPPLPDPSCPKCHVNEVTQLSYDGPVPKKADKPTIKEIEDGLQGYYLNPAKTPGQKVMQALRVFISVGSAKIPQHLGPEFDQVLGHLQTAYTEFRKWQEEVGVVMPCPDCGAVDLPGNTPECVCPEKPKRISDKCFCNNCNRFLDGKFYTQCPNCNSDDIAPPLTPELSPQKPEHKLIQKAMNVGRILHTKKENVGYLSEALQVELMRLCDAALEYEAARKRGETEPLLQQVEFERSRKIAEKHDVCVGIKEVSPQKPLDKLVQKAGNLARFFLKDNAWGPTDNGFAGDRKKYIQELQRAFGEYEAWKKSADIQDAVLMPDLMKHIELAVVGQDVIEEGLNVVKAHRAMATRGARTDDVFAALWKLRKVVDKYEKEQKRQEDGEIPDQANRIAQRIINLGYDPARTPFDVARRACEAEMPGHFVMEPTDPTNTNHTYDLSTPETRKKVCGACGNHYYKEDDKRPSCSVSPGGAVPPETPACDDFDRKLVVIKKDCPECHGVGEQCDTCAPLGRAEAETPDVSWMGNDLAQQVQAKALELYQDNFRRTKHGLIELDGGGVWYTPFGKEAWDEFCTTMSTYETVLMCEAEPACEECGDSGTVAVNIHGGSSVGTAPCSCGRERKTEDSAKEKEDGSTNPQ